MRRLFSALIAGILIGTPALAADRFEFDKSHTRILFFINHLGFSETVGEFTDYDGHFTFDEKAPETSSVDITLKPAGIRTPSTDLDKHLQAPDWFNTEKYPDIRFVSTDIKVNAASKTADVTGNLTMLGVTKPVVLHVTFNKADYHPMAGFYVAGFKGEATLKRSDFGFTNAIPMVGDEVRLLVHTEGMNKTRMRPAPEKK